MCCGNLTLETVCIYQTNRNNEALYMTSKPILFTILNVVIVITVFLGFFILSNPRITKNHPAKLYAVELLIVAFYYQSFSCQGYVSDVGYLIRQYLGIFSDMFFIDDKSVFFYYDLQRSLIFIW